MKSAQSCRGKLLSQPLSMRPSSRASVISSSPRGDDTHSSSSLSNTVTVLPRPCVRSLRQRSMERFRVMPASHTSSLPGRSCGMAFHTRAYVSLTHSSASSRTPRMFIDTARQYAPYLLSVSSIAFSSRCQYRSIIFESSIAVLLRLYGAFTYKDAVSRII